MMKISVYAFLGVMAIAGGVSAQVVQAPAVNVKERLYVPTESEFNKMSADGQAAYSALAIQPVADQVAEVGAEVESEPVSAPVAEVVEAETVPEEISVVDVAQETEPVMENVSAVEKVDVNAASAEEVVVEPVIERPVAVDVDAVVAEEVVAAPEVKGNAGMEEKTADVVENSEVPQAVTEEPILIVSKTPKVDENEVVKIVAVEPASPAVVEPVQVQSAQE